MKYLNSSFEGELVKYYDSFFLGNRVSNEVAYIERIINKYGSEDKKNSLIDIGGGTGIHATEFSEYYKNVMVIDISQDMVNYAKEYHAKSNVEYLCCDICFFEWDRKYNVATALSHVIGYQLSNSAVENMLIHTNRLLDNKGFFFFNFYNEPALYTGKLESRVQKVSEKDANITRFSNAKINADENCLELDYYYIIEPLENRPLTIEIHEKMRYFTKKELEFYIDKTGFRVIKFFNYATENDLSCDEWNAGVLVQKVKDV